MGKQEPYIDFDLDAMRKQFTDAQHQSIIETRPLADNDFDQRIIDVQEKLIPVRVEAAVLQAELKTNGYSHHEIALGLGAVLGNMVLGALANLPEDERTMLLHAFQFALNANSDVLNQKRSDFYGTQGGRA